MGHPLPLVFLGIKYNLHKSKSHSMRSVYVQIIIKHFEVYMQCNYKGGGWLLVHSHMGSGC